MYQTDNSKIGKHLKKLIVNSKYKNARQFAIAYLKMRDKEKYNADDNQKMQNRISQIINGNKAVQIYDIPLFSELLGVSAENILSGGTCIGPLASRKCNYSIAFSNNPSEWKEYIEREDKPFLNLDEFNKTVIDYALEACNFPFLKYLMDERYIWFVGDNQKDYYLGFGAGTSVKRRELVYDNLNYILKEQDDLRFKMISISIDNNCTEMLDKLKAREIPLLYTINPMHLLTLRDKRLPTSPNVTQMIDSIAASSTALLSYFFEEFEVTSGNSTLPNTFIFPYAGQVLDRLITNKRIQESKCFLEKSFDHNKRILRRLQRLVDKSIEKCKEFKTNPKLNYYNDSHIMREAWQQYFFYPDTGFVSYCMPLYCENATGFITNVINVTASSNNPDVQFLIDELNKTYDTFIKYFKEKER